MSLLQLKPRPLDREATTWRDDRLIIVACDDTYAPKQYFKFFQNPRVHVFVIPTLDGTCGAADVLNRLLQYDHEKDDELWLLLGACRNEKIRPISIEARKPDDR